MILECVPREVARIITARLRVPTISYGAGVHCDGQGMVSADMLGLFEQFTPRFAKRYVDLATQISGAFKSYCERGGCRAISRRQTQLWNQCCGT